MRTNPKKKLLAALTSLALVSAIAGLAGCQSGGRTTGRMVDDNTVNRRVKSALANAPMYKFPGIRVETYAGIVQLSGFVDSQEQKLEAGQVASQVEGVHQVVNSLAVKPNVQLTPTGATTGRRIDAATYTPEGAAPIVTSTGAPLPSTPTTTTTTRTNIQPTANPPKDPTPAHNSEHANPGTKPQDNPNTNNPPQP